MRGSLRCTVSVTWRAANGERRKLQKEHRFVPGTPKRVREAWKVFWRAKLEKHIPALVSDRVAVLGTLKADAKRYFPLIRHHADPGTRESEIRAWFPELGDKPRHLIERTDALTVVGLWKTAGVAHRTINNRVSALKDLYRKLDGDDLPTPCDRIPFLKPPRTPVQRVSPETIRTVLDALLVAGLSTPGRGRPGEHALQDRARLMVMATTGRRQCEIERTQPGDISLEQCVWGVRDAKGGWSEGIYLNAEMYIAWETFIATDAWGAFPDHFPRRLRAAGWPAGVRPYNVRHSLWIAASEAGADLADIQAGAGHRSMRTTREHYVPVLGSRMQKLGELIDGRLGLRTAPKDT